MKHNSIAAALVLLVSPALIRGCGIPPISVDEKTLQQVQRTTEAMQKSMTVMSDSIPGAFYGRMIQDLNGPDPEKRKAAQDFLMSLGHLDPQASWEVSAWFEFDVAKPLHARIFRATLPNQEEIVARYKQGFLVNPGNVASTPIGGPSHGDVEKTVRDALSSATEALDRLRVKHADYPFGGIGWNSLDAEKPCGEPGSFEYYANCMQAYQAYTTGERARMQQARKDIAANMFTAFQAFYHDWPIPIDAKTLSLDWSLFDERQALFVIISEEDWQAHKGKVEVRALLHKKGEPQSPLAGVQVEVFTLDEWKKIDLKDANQPPRSFRWAVRTMTDTNLLSATTVEQVRNVQAALKAWQELQQPKN